MNIPISPPLFFEKLNSPPSHTVVFFVPPVAVCVDFIVSVWGLVLRTWRGLVASTARVLRLALKASCRQPVPSRGMSWCVQASLCLSVVVSSCRNFLSFSIHVNLACCPAQMHDCSVLRALSLGCGILCRGCSCFLSFLCFALLPAFCCCPCWRDHHVSGGC